MVEIIPKKQAKAISLRNISLFIIGALLIATVFSYVVLFRIETKALNYLQDLETDIAQVGTKQDRAIEEKVFDYEKKIKNLAILLAARLQSAVFFDNFEKLIHPKVWFSSFELDASQMRATVSGKADDFKMLEQQLVFIQSKSDFIKATSLSDLTIGDEGGADFNINFNFKPEIFKEIKE